MLYMVEVELRLTVSYTFVQDALNKLIIICHLKS